MEVAHKIHPIIGDAMDTIENAVQQFGPFDLIFLDADKENHHRYFEIALNSLSENGVIAIDNSFGFGLVADSEVNSTMIRAVQQLNQTIADDSRFIKLVPGM